MKTTKKTIFVVALISILIIIGIIFIFILPAFFENKRVNQGNSNTVDVPEEQISIDELIAESNYSVIESTEEITNIYDSVKKIIYYFDIEDIDNISKNDLSNITSYNIKRDDILNIKKEDNYSYGYIKKELFDKQIENIFGDNSTIMQNKLNKIVNSYNNLFYFNVGDDIKRGTIIEQSNDSYYFKFSGGEGTWAWPVLEKPAIKLTEIRKVNNYLLLISKAVYSKCSSENENNSATVTIYNDFENNNVIDSINIPLGATYNIDVDKYIDNASEVYLVLKLNKKGNYQLYKSKRNK